MQAVAAIKYRIYIVLTNTAREAILEHAVDEQAFFKQQKAFVVYVEKVELLDNQIACTLYFDGEKNQALKKQFPGRVVIMDCLFDTKSGLVAKSFRTRGKGTPVATNRRARMLLEIVPSRMNGHKYPPEFLQQIAELPFAKERYEFVNKRITSWEGYLKVQGKNADFEDIEATFSKLQFNSTYTHITMRLSGVNGKQWKQLDRLSARVKGFHQDLGDVVKVHKGEQMVEIELKPDMARRARKHDLQFDYNQITFSNMATKSQLNRLLKGFERLKEGLAMNPRLENILFDDVPAVSKTRKPMEIEFSNRLNEFQQAAVRGAMETEDLYVIQGPPGTGKTTVISEICYQNAVRGLKTLVASQSNLAVDNALSRLLSNKDIRILRYGRTESIEEDGKRFIEENVGAYWKEVTTNAIQQAVDQHETEERSLRTQIEEAKSRIEQLNVELNDLEKRFELQKQCEKEKPELEKQIRILKKKISEANKTLDSQIDAHVKLEGAITEQHEKLKAIDAKLAKLFSDFQFNDEDVLAFKSYLQTKLAAENEALTELLEQKEWALLIEDKKRLEAQLELKKEELKQFMPKESTNRDEEINSLKKVRDVEKYIEDNQIRRSFVIDRLNAALLERQQKLERFKGIKELYERLNKALHYSETRLEIVVAPDLLPATHNYDLDEVDQFLTKLSKAFKEQKVNRENGRRSIQGIHLRKQYVENEMIVYQALIEDTVVIFQKLKEELLRLFHEQEIDYKQQFAPIEEAIANLEGQLFAFNARLQEIDIDSIETLSKLEDNIRIANQTIQKLEAAIAETSIIHDDQTTKRKELEEMEAELAEFEATKRELETEIKGWHREGIDLEKRLAEVNEVLAEDVTAKVESTRKAQVEKEQQIAQLEAYIEKLPLMQSMQKQLLQLLENATDEDVDEIRKLYVKHANVIGTTCVTSANKEFMDNYPNFDVVIIDEVSKATPPELLLPMLKGAKIILVGDHHQLPPLIGDDTLEETLEQVMKESSNFEEKRELEKLLEESLFERLYNSLPRANKQMLAIQYRMHENIMQTIAPFYADEEDQLLCGLENSDEARDHKLETTWFDRSNHLLWVDVPNEQTYYEQKPKEGSSLFNEAELNIVKNTLLQLNTATAEAIDNGLLPEGTLKSVGVISYYAEQVKRINRLIEQELQLPHLQIRTGSVDKFQGMEMDVILVSMVRNHAGEQIGFAKDYRRLNVALSRSRELLMMIGSSDMFAVRPKQNNVRKMYRHVLETAKIQDGYVAAKEVELLNEA